MHFVFSAFECWHFPHKSLATREPPAFTREIYSTDFTNEPGGVNRLLRSLRVAGASVGDGQSYCSWNIKSETNLENYRMLTKISLDWTRLSLVGLDLMSLE